MLLLSLVSTPESKPVLETVMSLPETTAVTTDGLPLICDNRVAAPSAGSVFDAVSMLARPTVRAPMLPVALEASVFDSTVWLPVPAETTTVFRMSAAEINAPTVPVWVWVTLSVS